MMPKLCIFLLLVVGQVMTTNGGFIDSVVNSVCASGIATVEIEPCLNDLLNGIEPYANERGELPSFAVCCQINIFESCVSNKVKSICGSDAGDATRTVIRSALKGLKILSNGELDCIGHVYYDPASPVCWPIPAQVGAGLLLAAIILGCCCACVCRRGRNGKGTVQSAPTLVHLMPTTSAPPYQPAGGTGGAPRYVPYKHLNKTNV